jgi:phage-related protein
VPETTVVFYRDSDGSVPALDWLRAAKQRDHRITVKFHERILALKELGWEMTRPAADTLRDGIHELRVRFGNVNYRLLYGFHDQEVAVLTHGVVKHDVVPDADIDLARRRLDAYSDNPQEHTYVRPRPLNHGEDRA